MQRSREKSEAGFALLATLVVLAFLSILALMLANKFRTEARISQMKSESLEIKALSETAFTHAILGLTNPDPKEAWKADGANRTIELKGRKAQVRIRDELGKLDINTANRTQLKLFFMANDDDEDRVDHILDAMEDWRDANNSKEPRGAEAADYRREGYVILPSNAPFESVGDLARVMDMDEDLYVCVAPALTVHSQRRALDEARAHPLLVTALKLGTGDAEARAVSAIRGGLGGRTFEIEINIPKEDGSEITSRTILRITENRNEPYWILEKVIGPAAEKCKREEPLVEKK